MGGNAGELRLPDIRSPAGRFNRCRPSAEGIEPIWTTKPETASRVRGRVEVVLDWAGARGYREGENPARWRGHLDKLLPAPAKAKCAARQKQGRDEHHAALPYGEIAAFLAELRGMEGHRGAGAGIRDPDGGAHRGSAWRDLGRDRSGEPHLDGAGDPAALIFRGTRAGRPLSNMAFLMLLRRMQRDDLTGHGFRSTFRDWAAERTNFPNEVTEMALAHAIGDKVEVAYRRGDLFQKRRQLMDAWARFCAAPAGDGAIAALRARG
jgi:integrase